MCGDGIVTLSLLPSKIPDLKCSIKIRAIFDDVSQSIAPRTNNQAASLADHSRGSWNEDCITVLFKMKAVVDVSLASGASSVVNWQCSAVVGVVIVNKYLIMKGADRGLRSQMVQVIRRVRSNRGGNRWSLRSLKRRGE